MKNRIRPPKEWKDIPIGKIYPLACAIFQSEKSDLFSKTIASQILKAKANGEETIPEYKANVIVEESERKGIIATKETKISDKDIETALKM